MHLEMHDPQKTLGQFNPLMKPKRAHIHVLMAAAGTRPGQAGDNFVRRQVRLTGSFMIGAGFPGGGWGAFCCLAPGSAFLLGRFKQTVLGRRLVGIGGIAIQRFLQGEILLAQHEILLLERNDCLTQRKVFLPQFVHQFD